MAVKYLSIKTVYRKPFNLISPFIIYVTCCIFFLASCNEQHQKSVSVKHLKSLRTVDTTWQKLNFLQMEEYFWQNRLKMAEDETIDLIIDLVEDKVVLEVKGVPLRNITYDVLKRDFRITGQDLVQWCASPFILIREESTIPKEPIRIRRLPEESSKIEEGYNLEFLNETGPVFIRLYFDRSIEVEFIEHGISIPDSLTKNFTRLNWMQITLNRDDIIAIFRALPTNAQMILRLEQSIF
jgi:hypothetical protein